MWLDLIVEYCTGHWLRVIHFPIVLHEGNHGRYLLGKRSQNLPARIHQHELVLGCGTVAVMFSAAWDLTCIQSKASSGFSFRHSPDKQR